MYMCTCVCVSVQIGSSGQKDIFFIFTCTLVYV